MGSGTSMPKEGVLANPRSVYASERAKQLNKKEYRIDAPVLIDLKHGSIRYREAAEVKNSKNKSREIEKPFEGDDKQNKGHYFYHPRLNDFSEKASEYKEEPHKFMYVVKGPASAKQKKIFYVFGKGWDAKDGELTKPARSKAMGSDPTWPQRQNPNNVYYNIIFIDQVPSDDPIPGIPNRHSMDFAIESDETADSLRKKIAKTILKAAMYIHICYLNNEISGDCMISSLRNDEGNQPSAVRAVLMDQ